MKGESAQSPGRAVGVLLLLIAALLWSVSGYAVRKAGADPIVFATLRSLGAALTIGPLIPLGRRLTGHALPSLKLMAGLGIVHTLMVVSLIAAMTYATAAEGILLQYSAPAWVALVGWLVFGRKIDRATFLSLGLATVGVLVIVVGGVGSMGSVGRASLLGPLLGVVAGIGYAGVILGLDAVDTDAKARTGGPVNVFFVVWVNNAVSGLILLPWAFSRGLADLPPGTLVFILAVGAIQMAAPYALFQLGIRRVGPVAAGLLALAEPLLNPVLVFLAFGEVPPPAAFAGGGLILLAVVVVALFGRRRGVKEPEAEAHDLSVPPQ